MQQQILLEIFSTGFYKKEFNIGSEDSPFFVTLKSLSNKDQQAIEDGIRDYKGTQRKIISQYALLVLEKAVIKVNGKALSPEQITSWLEDKPVALTQKLINLHRDLEKEVSKALQVEEVEKTFSPGADQSGESKPSQEELMSEKITP